MARDARYDGLADQYEAFVEDDHSGVIALATATLLRLLDRGSGRCLDVGCGAGHVLPRLAELGWTPVGIDESHDMLERARRRAPQAETIQGDAVALPFPDGSFDAAVLRGSCTPTWPTFPLSSKRCVAC